MQKKILFLVAARWELPQEFPYSVKEIGVGILRSAWGFYEIINTENPELVILLGTAGALNAPMEFVYPMPPVLCNRFSLPPYAFEERPSLVQEFFSTGGIPRLDEICPSNYVVYSPFGITIKEKNVFYLKENKNYLENLEALGLAFLAHEKKLPFYALLSITNPVGERAREMWRKNYVKAGYLLLEKVKKILSLF